MVDSAATQSGAGAAASVRPNAQLLVVMQTGGWRSPATMDRFNWQARYSPWEGNKAGDAAEPRMSYSDPYIYECNLDVPAWSENSNSRDPEKYRPRLIFVRHYGKGIVLSQVSFWIGGKTIDDRWMVQFYPPDDRQDLPEHEDEAEWSWRRPPRLRHQDPSLEQGEIRHPRTTATEAIKLAMELLVGIVPKAEFAAFGKLADIHKPTLEKVSRAYAVRFRSKP